MPGRRHAGFRSGDLTEGLALELLRPIAFVAPTPRPEDVGFDAVATVFRRENPFLYAERSFLVQVKAASEQKVKYAGRAVDWFRNLELPLYFLKVDMRTCTAMLYAPCRATRHPNFRDRKEVSLLFNDTPATLKGDGLSAGFGAPILRWTAENAQDKAFCRNVHEVLSCWIELDTLAIHSRRFGIARQIEWETNRMPKARENATILQGPEDMPTILRGLKLAYESALVIAFNESADDDDLRATALR